MSVKVCKFGGTSLADAAQIQKACAIVKSDAERRYVVVSAPGKRFAEDQKITDLLYLCHAHAQQGIAFDQVFTLITDRYQAIIDQLGITLDLQPRLEQVKQDIAQGASEDYTASRGEYLNAPIVAAVLGYAFVDAAEVICFDDGGQLDTQETRQKMNERLKREQMAVIPGFFGAMPDGSIKTFSRGGSDVTGALVAQAVGASVYENWSDVSGLLCADPRVVDEPRTIHAMTYRELRELAYMGASVMHDEAIFPVREARIPVNIRNTNEPTHPGTMILPDTESLSQPQHCITGIAGRKDFTVIAIEKALMNTQRGFGRRVLEVLESHDISFEHMPSGIDTMSIVIADAQLQGKLQKVLGDIEAACKPDTVVAYPDMALIATVGRGMAHTPGISGRLFGALGEAGVNIRMIDQGSSELNIIVGVEADDFEKAVRAIYRAFVSSV